MIRVRVSESVTISLASSHNPLEDSVVSEYTIKEISSYSPPCQTHKP